jgi:NADH:ubiquinone oxidoreductase subunit 5 (subunit L)/multisubunit Na+/H+ antiporter MnhA subunit
MFEYYEWLLLVFPTAAALLNGLLGRRASTRAQYRIAIGAAAGVLFISLPLLIGLSLEPGLIGRPNRLDWIDIWSGSRFITAPFSLRIDALSIWILVAITIAELFVHVQAVDRLRDVPDRHVVLSLMSVKLVANLIAVLADDLFFLLLGWSLAGWCARALHRALSPSSHSPTATTDEPIVPQIISDLCLVVAVCLIGSAYASTAFHDVIAGQPPPKVNEVPAETEVLATLLIVISAGIRSAQFPFSTQPINRRDTEATYIASAHPLTSAALAVCLLARLHPLLERVPVVSPLLLVWGAITMLAMSLAAFLSPDRTGVTRWLALGQGGMLFLALGAGLYSTAIAYLPAYLLANLLLAALLPPSRSTRPRRDRQFPRLTTALTLGAAVGIPPTPTFVFGTQLMAALLDQRSLFFWPTLISALLLIAGSVQSLVHPQGRSTGGSWDQPRLMFAALLLILILGLVALASPLLIGRFLEPILVDRSPQPPWWSFVIASVVVAGGIGLGYLGRARNRQPAPAVRHGFERWFQQVLGTVPDRALTAAGTFIVDVLEPLAASATFGALADLCGRRSSAKEKPPMPPTLALLTFLLGMAFLIAFLLLQGGQGQ